MGLRMASFGFVGGGFHVDVGCLCLCVLPQNLPLSYMFAYSLNGTAYFLTSFPRLSPRLDTVTLPLPPSNGGVGQASYTLVAVAQDSLGATSNTTSSARGGPATVTVSGDLPSSLLDAVLVVSNRSSTQLTRTMDARDLSGTWSGIQCTGQSLSGLRNRNACANVTCPGQCVAGVCVRAGDDHVDCAHNPSMVRATATATATATASCNLCERCSVHWALTVSARACLPSTACVRGRESMSRLIIHRQC